MISVAVRVCSRIDYEKKKKRVLVLDSLDHTKMQRGKRVNRPPPRPGHANNAFVQGPLSLSSGAQFWVNLSALRVAQNDHKDQQKAV